MLTVTLVDLAAVYLRTAGERLLGLMTGVRACSVVVMFGLFGEVLPSATIIEFEQSSLCKHFNFSSADAHFKLST